jgi:hypothetical protein
MIKINFSFISKNISFISQIHSLSKIEALFFHNPEAESFFELIYMPGIQKGLKIYKEYLLKNI